MVPAGSGSTRPLSSPIAVAATVLGVGLMFASGFLTARLGLAPGLRGQVVFGTLLLVLPALLALAARPGAWRAALGPLPLRGRAGGLSILLGAALWVGSLGLMEIQSLVSPPPPQYLETFRALHRALAPASPLDTLASLAVIALLPAVCEELVVRGALLPSLVRPLGPGLAVAASAVLFAAMHLDPYRFLFTFAVGAVFGVVRLATGSLGPPVLAHLTLNALTFALAPIFDDPKQPYSPQPLLGAACLVAGAALTLPLLRALRRAPSPA